MSLQKPNYINLYQEMTQLAQGHISINLIGPYDTTSQGNSHSHSCMQSCQISHDHPYTRQKDNSSSYAFIFKNNTQIWVPMNFYIQTMEQNLSLNLEHLSQQLGIKKTYIFP